MLEGYFRDGGSGLHKIWLCTLDLRTSDHARRDHANLVMIGPRSMCGMAIADATGHPFEFLDCQNSPGTDAAALQKPCPFPVSAPAVLNGDWWQLVGAKSD